MQSPTFSHILSGLLFLPLLGAAAVLLLPKALARPTALLVTLLDFIWSLRLLQNFDAQKTILQFVERRPWIQELGVDYSLGIDGISLWLVLLTTFLGPVVVLSAWKAVERHDKAFFALLLSLQAGMLGAFFAADLFLFYIFWEAMLIPMYFLIGIWGGKRRIYATMKFFIYTMFGSLFMLLGVIAVFFLHKQQFGFFSGDITALYNLALSREQQILLFLAFALSFAIKVPVFTLHTWLPDAHVEAPTAGSVILAGVLLKMGGYGFLRFALPMFPVGMQVFTPLMLALAVIGIVYGALVAMVQPDIKKLVAYSSVSHLGFVVLGIFALNLHGVTGGLYQMLNHGLSTGALFLIVGMIYERRHTREISEFGGLAKSIPLLSVCFLLATFSSIGLPGLNGFVGEFLILIGAFQLNPILSLIAGTGVILGAIYMLWMVQRVVFGPLKYVNSKLDDLSWREGLVLLPVFVMIVVMGIYPKPFLQTMEPSVKRLIQRVESGQQAHTASLPGPVAQLKVMP